MSALVTKLSSINKHVRLHRPPMNHIREYTSRRLCHLIRRMQVPLDLQGQYFDRIGP